VGVYSEEPADYPDVAHTLTARLRTEVGKGTCFSIYFPRLEPPKSPKPPAQ